MYDLVKEKCIPTDGSIDVTVPFNEALETCYQNKIPLYVSAGKYAVSYSGDTYGFKRCLYNKGVSIFGDGAGNTTIIPYGNVAADVDFIHVDAQAGNFNDFLTIDGISVWPAYPFFHKDPSGSNAIKGNRALWVLTNVAGINLSKLKVSRCYFFPGTGASLHMENNPALLPQGCPSNSLISDNALFSGIKLSNVGDSVVIERNIIRSGAWLCAPGISALVVSGALGTAGSMSIRDNNIDAMGGAIVVRNGRNLIIDSNNIEQSAGTGSDVGAVVDISGEVGQVVRPVISNNEISVFGTSNAARSLAIGNSQYAQVYGNKFGTDVARYQGVWVRSNAANTTFGFNQFSGPWTAKVTNEGTNTRSVQTVAGYSP